LVKALVAALLILLWPAAASAAVIYQASIFPLFTANADVGSFTNCRADQGCLGTAGNVDSNNDGAINAGDVGTLPNVLPFGFALTAAQQAAIGALATGSATLSMTAARDIGHKAGDPVVDFLVTTMEGVALGNLFQSSIDSCPAGERGVGYPATLVCGPNFHTDVTATDSLSIGLAALKTAAADGTINFAFDPTDSVGRLKIQEIRLVVQDTAAVPEPSSLTLLALALFALGVARRSRWAVRRVARWPAGPDALGGRARK
jgi:hypothetical protein